jgi:hypothetical protein
MRNDGRKHVACSDKFYLSWLTVIHMSIFIYNADRLLVLELLNVLRSNAHRHILEAT